MRRVFGASCRRQLLLWGYGLAAAPHSFLKRVWELEPPFVNNYSKPSVYAYKISHSPFGQLRLGNYTSEIQKILIALSITDTNIYIISNNETKYVIHTQCGKLENSIR